MIPGFHTGRILDPKYPPNRLLVILFAGVGLAGGVYRLLAGDGLLASAFWALGAALVFFFTWVVTRELDPDFDYAAFVAAFLGLGGLLIFGLPGILFLFWLPMLFRILNRTTGLPAGVLDAAGGLGITALLLYLGYWEVGLAAAAVFLLDALLAPPLRRQMIPFVLTLGLGVALAQIRPFNFTPTPPGEVVQALTALIALTFLPVVYLSRSLTSLGDMTGESLAPRRVQAVQMVALVTGLLLVYSRGDGGFIFSLPLWAAMLGSASYRLVSRIV